MPWLLYDRISICRINGGAFDYSWVGCKGTGAERGAVQPSDEPCAGCCPHNRMQTQNGATQLSGTQSYRMNHMEG